MAGSKVVVELRGMLVPVIAIDGTAGSGKGTVAALLADRLGFHLLESGRIYRAAGMMALQSGELSADNLQLSNVDNPQLPNVPPSAALDSRLRGNDGLVRVAENAARRLIAAIDNSGGESLTRVFDSLFAGEDLDGELAGKAASVLASVADARVALLPLQRAARKLPGLVAEGRDMGTVVFADAVVKLYLDADLQVRAARRLQQLQNRGVGATIADVRAGLAARDQKDKSRACAPLRRASDAVIFDSAECSAAEIADTAARLFLQVAHADAGAE